LVADALAIADEMQDQLSIEVVDLRSAFPLDRETLIASATKTRRVLVTDDGNRHIGLAAEVIASLAGVSLDSPPQRVVRADATIPFAPTLEQELLPNGRRIREAVVNMTKDARG
jgi:pyruvate dehydrogenase E1 component beta subunit